MERNIPAQETVVFDFKREVDNFGDLTTCTSYKISIPKITKCNYIDPTQFTYVTKFRNATKYRNETRYKADTKIIEKKKRFIKN